MGRSCRYVSDNKLHRARCEKTTLSRFSSVKDFRGQAEQLTLSPVDAARLIVTHTRGLIVIERVYRREQRMRSIADLLTQLLLKPIEP